MLATAGYRAVAMDLRGYGASDKPPRGYDPLTLAADAVGVVRALGAPNATVVGHGLGGLVAWTMAAAHPSFVRRLAVLSMPHPLASGRVPFALPASRLSRYTLGFQLPLLPERRLVRADAHNVVAFMRRGGGSPRVDPTAERRFRDAFQIPGVAHCALESHRWLVRSQLRQDGARYRARMRAPITAPTLQMHGAADTLLPAATIRDSRRHVQAPYRLRLIAGAGHFPHEERPDVVNGFLLDWLNREPRVSGEEQ